MGNGGKGRPLRGGDHLEAGRQRGDMVAVAHPDLMLFTLAPQPVKQRAVPGHFQKSPAELLMVGGFHLAAQLQHHGLLAVANPQDGHRHLEDQIRRPGAADVGGRRRAARQDDALGGEILDPLQVAVKRENLAVNAAFPHTPRDQLGYLGAEVENENAISHGG